MRNLIFCISIVLLLSCGMQNVKNQREARLMPETIAKDILAKYFGRAWVDSPEGKALHQGMCPGNYPMPFDTIEQIQVAPWGNNQGKMLSVHNWTLGLKSMLPPLPCGSVSTYRTTIDTKLTDQDIDDIVDAFVSLGAKIKEVKRN